MKVVEFAVHGLCRVAQPQVNRLVYANRPDMRHLSLHVQRVANALGNPGVGERDNQKQCAAQLPSGQRWRQHDGDGRAAEP